MPSLSSLHVSYDRKYLAEYSTLVLSLTLSEFANCLKVSDPDRGLLLGHSRLCQHHLRAFLCLRHTAYVRFHDNLSKALYSPGLYQQSRVCAASCHLTDADFLQALSAVGAVSAEASKGRGGKKAAKEQEAGDAKEKKGGAQIEGWDNAEKPPRFQNLQLLLRLLTTVSKLQVLYN